MAYLVVGRGLPSRPGTIGDKASVGDFEVPVPSPINHGNGAGGRGSCGRPPAVLQIEDERLLHSGAVSRTSW